MCSCPSNYVFLLGLFFLSFQALFWGGLLLNWQFRFQMWLLGTYICELYLFLLFCKRVFFISRFIIFLNNQRTINLPILNLSLVWHGWRLAWTPVSQSVAKSPPSRSCKYVCFYSQAGWSQGASERWWAFLSGRFTLSGCWGVLPAASQVSRCFFLPWRTRCTTLNPHETDYTPRGVADAATSGREPSSWGHGTWCVKWMMDVSKANG